MEKFIVTKKENEVYQFELLTPNGEVILTSKSYNSKETCIKGIETAKNNANIDARYERKIAKTNEYYFNLNTGIGEAIGSSQIYLSIFSRENGISAAKKYSSTAKIVEEYLI